MSYKIIIDSCGELTEAMKADEHFGSAALTLYVDDHTIVDDETFDQHQFLKLVAESPNCPKSACPSPESFRDKFDCGADHVYAVTLSSELSGSYNSAELGKNLFLEEHPEKKAYVFNSRSASVGETLIGLKIQECEEAGMEFEEVIKAVEAYQAERQTFFVLESLDHLRKNGRLSAVKAFVASALNIKPVMEGNKQGIIEQAGQARGMQKALRMMVELLVERMNKPEEKTVAIVHCNNEARAQFVKEEIEKRTKVKEIIILPSSGVSTLYAAQGGIILVG